MVAGTAPRRRHTSLIIEKPKHEWIPDSTRSSCTHCSILFTLFTRRHHCRSCGDIFCHDCSNHTAPVKVEKGEDPRVVRVCHECWKENIMPIPTQPKPYVQTTIAIPASTPTSTAPTPSTISSTPSSFTTPSSFNIRLLILFSCICLFITIILFFPSHCYSSFHLLSIPSRISVDVCSTHSLPITTSFLMIALFPLIIIGKMLHMKHEQSQSLSTTTTSTPTSTTGVTPPTSSQQRTYSPQHQHYLELSNYCMEELIKLTTSNDGWSVHATRDDITILQRNVGPTRNGLKARKIFRGDCIISGCTPTSLLQLLLQLSPERTWDKAIDGYTRLFQINDDVDVTHCVAAPAGGGTVAGRDFVDIRSTRKLENGYVTGGIGIPDYPVPPVKNVVRGINGIAGYGLFIVPNNPNACRVVWIMDSKLNGWLPQSVIDMSLSTVMMDFFTNTRAIVANRPHMAYRPS